VVQMQCFSRLQYSRSLMPFPAPVVPVSYKPPSGIRDSTAPGLGSASNFSWSMNFGKCRAQ
jgi:hypothetical protein